MRLMTVLLVTSVGCGSYQTGAGADAAADSSGPLATSCADLPETCGPLGTGSCCETPIVVGGTFYRSYDTAADTAYPDTSRPATVSDFRLDRYEVTVGRFRKFVESGQGTQTAPPLAGAGQRATLENSGWDASWNASLAADTAALVAGLKCDPNLQTWTDVPGDNERRPIACITWYEAMAFCAWDGGYLPTEAEWNYAATGGSQQRAYPWSRPSESTAIDCMTSNFGGASWPSTACVGAGTSNVGSVPGGDGAWGQSDLGGNIYEWALDWYASPYPNPCTDCANLFPATYRVVRGGSFIGDAPNLRTGYRNSVIPTVRFFNVGVRCLRTP